LPGRDARLPEHEVVASRLTDDDFAELTSIVREIAARHCDGRLHVVRARRRSLEVVRPTGASRAGTALRSRQPRALGR
jgi:hypothetical protein